METFISVALFLAGFYILVKGAHILVRGASSIATLLGFSRWFVGAVIVGIGTSIPEFAINVASAFAGEPVGISAIIGSNTFNTLFLIGIAALITPLSLKRAWIRRDVPINIAMALLTSAAIVLPIVGLATFGGITREEGGILLAGMLVWFFFLMFQRMDAREATDVRIFTITSSLVMIALGLVGVLLGGEWVLDGAVTLAATFNISHAFIGLTVVAIGTSLPELAVAITAAIRREPGVVVGTVLGSNIFDMLGILGITALIHPIRVEPMIRLDILATLVAAALFTALALFVGRRFTIGRFEGVVLVAAYIVYVVLLALRG